MNLIQYLVVLASYVKFHRVVAMMLQEIFQFDLWSLYQLGFRSDHFLLVEYKL